MPLYMKLTFMCGHYVCQFMSKDDQKQNWVKLKSVGLIYIYSIGQQGKPYIKAFDLRLEAVQHNI